MQNSNLKTSPPCPCPCPLDKNLENSTDNYTHNDNDDQAPRVIVTGTNGSAIVYTDELDNESRSQLGRFLGTRAAVDGHVRVMPDVHAGSGCVIGFTSRFNDWLIPSVIGVDIGCGVTAWRIGKPLQWDSRDKMFCELDKFIRANVPSGFEQHSNAPLSTRELAAIYDRMIDRKIESYAPATYSEFVGELDTLRKKLDSPPPLSSLGTLGGGNHFIEIDEEPTTGDLWFVVHTGSRNIGKRTADFHQHYAFQLEQLRAIETIKARLNLTADASESDTKSLGAVKSQLSTENACEIVLQYLKERFGEATGEKFDDLSPQQAIHELETLITKKNSWCANIGITAYGQLSEYAVQKLSLEGNKRAINSTRKLISTFCVPSKTSAIKKIDIFALCIEKNISLDEVKVPENASETDELDGEAAEAYKHDMCTAQLYAKLNRRVIIYTVATKFFGIAPEKVPLLAERLCGDAEVAAFGDFVESVHNYIDFTDKVVRKGSISAHLGEKVIIPLSMQQGVVLGVGKGNEEWNCSAPHGAGRKMSRGKARKTLTLDEFKNDMKGIWTSCVNEETIDEAPRAYKDADKITQFLKDSVDVVSRMFPVYNFKAGAE